MKIYVHYLEVGNLMLRLMLVGFCCSFMQ